MMLRLLIPVLVLLAGSACSDLTGSAGRLHTDADGSAVVLTNGTARTVYHFAVDSESLPLINWAPCSNPSYCTGTPAGGVERLPYDSIFSHTPGPPQEVTVFAWHLIPRTGGTFEVRMLSATPGRLRL
jgi:hypothetical protein